MLRLFQARVLVTVALVVSGTAAVRSAAADPTAATLQVSPRISPPSLPFTVKGKGFKPREVVDISFDDTLIGKANADPSGTFTKRVAVPADAPPGTHAVVGTGETSGLTAGANLTVRTNWPRFHFDAGHTGFNPYENVLSTTNVSTLVQKWAVPTAGGASPSPVVSGGTVFVAPADGVVRALDPATGATIWSVDTGAAMSGAAPDVTGGVLYVGDENGVLWAIAAANGSVVWSHDLGSLIESTPVVADGLVYVNVLPKGTLAVEAATGEFVWQASGVFGGWPAVIGGVVYVTIDAISTYVEALDGRTGRERWSALLCDEGCAAGPPAAAADRVFMRYAFDLLAFDAATGDLLWDAYPAPFSYSTPALAEGSVYASTIDDTVEAWDQVGGALLWQQSLNGGTDDSSPAVANGVLYVGAEDGSLHAYEAATGAILWTSPSAAAPIRSSPAVSDGVVFISADDGTVYAYGLP
jgi:outer membrane protein assembly factor BamB